MSKLVCFSCNKEIQITGVVGRRDECPQCHADQHSCRNCGHYDPKSYNECREPSAEVVKEKDRANFCDQFVANGTARSGVDQKAQILSAAEALFKKKI